MLSWNEFLTEKGEPITEAKKKGEGLPKDVEKAQEKPGGSNVGKERKTSGAKEGPFCGPSGKSPKGSFPVTSEKQAKSAKAYARHAPDPQGVKSCVDKIAKKKGWFDKDEDDDKKEKKKDKD